MPGSKKLLSAAAVKDIDCLDCVSDATCRKVSAVDSLCIDCRCDDNCKATFVCISFQPWLENKVSDDIV